MELDRRGAEMLFRVLAEREEKPMTSGPLAAGATSTGQEPAAEA